MNASGTRRMNLVTMVFPSVLIIFVSYLFQPRILLLYLLFQILGVGLQTCQQLRIRGCQNLRSQLATQPRTKEGNFWHKDIYPWQVWLDGT